MFESNCHLLNTKQYKGLRRVKVEIWLLFEDQTSSVYAKITQASLMLLIVFSTILILVQSYGRCKWVSEPAEGRPLAQSGDAWGNPNACALFDRVRVLRNGGNVRVTY